MRLRRVVGVVVAGLGLEGGCSWMRWHGGFVPRRIIAGGGFFAGGRGEATLIAVQRGCK